MMTADVFKTMVRLKIVDNWDDMLLWMLWMQDVKRFEGEYRRMYET